MEGTEDPNELSSMFSYAHQITTGLTLALLCMMTKFYFDIWKKVNALKSSADIENELKTKDS
jgi:hypothetical protein